MGSIVKGVFIKAAPLQSFPLDNAADDVGFYCAMFGNSE